MEIPGFLKHGEKDSLIFNEDNKYMVFYIPEMYFEREFAEIDGEFISLIGIFTYSIFDSKTNKSTTGLRRFDFPSLFVTVPSEIESVKNIKLTKNTPARDYKLLKFYKGDTVISSTKYSMQVENVEDFLKMYNSGAMPNIVPYDKGHQEPLDNVQMNGYNYNVSASIIGVIHSELCRSSSDITIPFRLSGSKDMTDYQMINIKDGPNFTSPFTALTSENWDESVAYGLINKKPKDSPLERLFIDPK